MVETLEHWMLTTPTLRLNTGPEMTHGRVMFIAQGRCIYRGKRQTVKRVKPYPGRTLAHGRRQWRICDEEEN